LKSLGYRIVGRRERVLRGDIDIVALDGRTVVFVEVRSKSDTAHGHPAETVGPVKQRRIAELAAAYIRRHKLEDQSVRIDVVAVTFPAGGRPVVEHYQNAFDSPW
jgi:putative endonuclease